MAAATGVVKLTIWMHPSMKLPFEVTPEVFTIGTDGSVADLMDRSEEWFDTVSEKASARKELQINVLWNIKTPKKALNPNDKIGQHFVDGDTFGIYGDIIDATIARDIPECDKLPVTILTGFLGAGKTTLLNYILKEQRERKIAIIENEFGEVSIDDALLKQDKMAMAEKIITMDNGCMCCTIRGDLEKGLKSILEEVHNGKPIDAIMIETTGMADPVPIVRTFMSDPTLTAELRLDGVIAVADCKNLIARLDDDVEEGKVNEAYQQVAFADKIILNKLDLVTSDEAIVVKDRIRAINSFAKIIPGVKGRVKLTELSNMRAHDMVNFAADDTFGVEAGDLKADAAEEDLSKHTHGGHGGHEAHGGGGHGHDEACAEEHGGGHGGGGHGGGHGGGGHGGHGGHGDAAGHGGGHEAEAGHAVGLGHSARPDSRHDARVNSFGIVREGEIIPRKLAAWMQSLGQLEGSKGTIFRIKAILAVKGHPFKHVFHAVMDVSDEDDAGEWAEGEKKISKIVFIGKSLDQAFLRKGFNDIFE